MNQTAGDGQWQISEPQDRQNLNDEFAAELFRLGDLIDRLEMKLATVLMQQTPVGLEQKRDISSVLREGVYKFSDLNTRLVNVLDRIDL